MFSLWKKKDQPSYWDEVLSSELSALYESPQFSEFRRGLEAAADGDFTTAVNEWTLIAEQGNDSAQFILGLLYHKGEGVDQDYEESQYWIQKAASQENANAQYFQGRLYFEGDNVDKNYESAVYWFRRAAEQGNTYAHCYLGLCYGQGLGVEKDRVRADMWFIIAESLGSEMGKRSRRLIEKQYVDGGMTSSEKAEARILARECASDGFVDW